MLHAMVQSALKYSPCKVSTYEMLYHVIKITQVSKDSSIHFFYLQTFFSLDIDVNCNF